MPSSSSALATEFEEQLIEYGTKLLDPPSAVDELLKLLEIIEQLLIVVDQSPSHSMQDALLPCMMGLIATNILRHPDMDVKVSVAFCMSEITRITAPDPPYNDEQMKEIFQLTLATFDNLVHASDRYYKKAVSILGTVSKVKSCLMMLDLELDDLIIQMFRQFLEIIGSTHSSTVFSAMETIMIDVIDESDDISLGLLTPLLESVRKEKQDVSTLSWKLGEKVITSCAAKLKPYLMEAVKFTGSALDDYAQIVANTCENKLDAAKNNSVHISQEHLLEPEPGNLSPSNSAQSPISPGRALLDFNRNSQREVENRSTEQSKASAGKCIVENKNVEPKEAMELEIVPKSVTKKRGRKPNSLRKPEEGYDHSLIFAEKKDDKVHHKRKSLDIESFELVLGLPALPSKRTKMTNNLDFPSENIEKEEISVLPNQPVASGRVQKRGRKKSTGSFMREDDPNSVSSSEKFSSSANITEEALDSSALGLEKEVKVMSDSKEKPRRHSKKIGHSSNTGKEAIAEGDIVSEKGADGSSGPKKKLLQKLSPRDTEKDTGAINSGEDHTDKFNSQRLRATTTPKSTPKRKCSGSGTEKAYEMGDLDGRLIGKKIEVWWPLDKTFYEGVIESFDAKKKRHKILYTDGEVEILNLYKKRWKLIPEGVSLDGEKTDIEIASPLPVSSSSGPKRRRKSKLVNKDKVASSSRRSEKEEKDINSGYETLVESKIDRSNIDGSDVGASGGGEKLEVAGASFGGNETLEDEGIRSGGGQKPQDDNANSGKFEKMREDGIKSADEKLKEDSVISKGGEKLKDGGEKSGGGEIEISRDDDANSKHSEKTKEGGVKSGDDKLKDGCVISEGAEKLKDGGVKSGLGEKSKDDGASSGGVNSEIGEMLKEDKANSGQCEELEDDVVNATEQLNDEELVNARDNSMEENLNNQLSGDVLNEETSGNVVQTISKTETTSEVGGMGDEGKSNEEKSESI